MLVTASPYASEEDTDVVIVAVAVAFVPVVGLLALVISTGLGAHRRGLTPLTASLAGLLFPITWTVWYIRDERPYRRAHRHGT